MRLCSHMTLRIPVIFVAFTVAAPALAGETTSWRDIDFKSCPLNDRLRVADDASASHYMALQGCAARIVIAPKAPIRAQPNVARIIGVKEDKAAKARKRRAVRNDERLAEPPPGTERINAMLDRPIRLGRIDPGFNAHILASARAHRIDPLFLHAIIGQESTYKPQALSHAGARGLMQIMPGTGARFGVATTALYDPATNIDTGARLLKSLQGRYGKDFNLILAAYNAGEGAVAKYGNAIPPYRETQDYVVKVMGRYAALRGGVGQ